MSETDPRPVLFSILEDVIPCRDRDLVLTIPGIQRMWSHAGPAEFLWFWTELFVQNPELVRRMKGAYNEIGRAFVDLERLHAHVYGTPTMIPPAIVDMIRRRVLASWFASSREVLDYTVKGATVTRAAHDIKRFIGEEAWRKEF